MIVLDTNVVSALMLRIPDQKVVSWLNRQPGTSIWTTSITVFEVRFGLEILPKGKRRATLLDDFEKFLHGIHQRIVPFDSEAAREASVLMAERRIQGRPREFRDTMIAGIVIACHATLATRNIRDFSDIRAKCIDPWID
jgi:predicted nucleic acid-binding protein